MLRLNSHTLLQPLGVFRSIFSCVLINVNLLHEVTRVLSKQLNTSRRSLIKKKTQRFPLVSKVSDGMRN